MRVSGVFITVTLGLLSLQAGGKLEAQQSYCNPLPGVARVYARAKKLPYVATITVNHEQKLIDGNSIHTSVVSHQARSESGKIMNEMMAGCYTDNDGKQQPIRHYTVFDPTTRTTYSWNIGPPLEKTAHVSHQTTAPAPQPVSPDVQEKRRVAAEQYRQTQ